MTLYLVEARDRIFVKGYGFLPFTKKIGKNVDKNISNYLSSKYSQKVIDHTKQSATYTLKIASKELFRKQQKPVVI